VAQGGSVHDAATVLGLSKSTVKRHLADVRSRTGLTTEQLIYVGRSLGWLRIGTLENEAKFAAHGISPVDVLEGFGPATSVLPESPRSTRFIRHGRPHLRRTAACRPHRGVGRRCLAAGNRIRRHAIARKQVREPAVSEPIDREEDVELGELVDVRSRTPGSALVAVRMPRDLLARIAAYGQQRGMTVSEVMREGADRLVSGTVNLAHYVSGAQIEGPGVLQASPSRGGSSQTLRTDELVSA
jgi:hypothetical protein